MREGPRIGILLFDGVEELDAVGPYEVFASWAHHWPGDGASVVAFTTDGSLVTAAKGLEMGAQRSMANLGALDVLVHPGGRGTRALAADPAHLDWVRARRADTPLLCSVCTGALVYAAAGLLARRPATTHWAALDELAALDASIVLRGNDRVVDDGDVVTSAGVSAGIDMALHLVARLESNERAAQVRRAIQYDPAPPV